MSTKKKLLLMATSVSIIMAKLSHYTGGSIGIHSWASITGWTGDMSPHFLKLRDVICLSPHFLGENLILYIYYFTKFATLVSIYLHLLTVS